MRIAIYTDNFHPELGGIQDSVATTARELGARGHAVAIFAPTATQRDYARANLAVEELQLGENVEIHRQFSIAIPGSTGQSRLTVPTTAQWRAVATFRPDLVHSHTFLGAGIEALAAARRLGVPLIGTNHWAVGGFALYAPQLAREACARICWRAVARFYNRCQWVSAPSRSTLEEMRAHGLERPAAVISNPIDSALFRPALPGERQRLRACWEMTGPTILFAGRLAREKRIEVLIRALAVLRRSMPGATLVIAGHGTAKPELRQLARELGVAARVRFTGTLSQPVLAELCRAADVFAIASTSESQSMMLLQAMSAGLPAVAARHGPLPDYLAGGAGLLAEANDPADFAARLGQLLHDPELHARASTQAVRMVAGFGVASVTDGWQDIYERAIRGAWRPAPARAWWRKSCA
jgi:glycosyltransferase involved in cell wall biosynthesis